METVSAGGPSVSPLLSRVATGELAVGQSWYNARRFRNWFATCSPDVEVQSGTAAAGLGSTTASTDQTEHSNVHELADPFPLRKWQSRSHLELEACRTTWSLALGSVHVFVKDVIFHLKNWDTRPKKHFFNRDGTVTFGWPAEFDRSEPVALCWSALLAWSEERKSTRQWRLLFCCILTVLIAEERKKERKAQLVLCSLYSSRYDARLQSTSNTEKTPSVEGEKPQTSVSNNMTIFPMIIDRSRFTIRCRSPSDRPPLYLPS